MPVSCLGTDSLCPWTVMLWFICDKARVLHRDDNFYNLWGLNLFLLVLTMGLKQLKPHGRQLNEPTSDLTCLNVQYESLKYYWKQPLCKIWHTFKNIYKPVLFTKWAVCLHFSWGFVIVLPVKCYLAVYILSFEA